MAKVFDMNSISAAHPTLPLPSYVRVTNLANHRSIVVRVNDRGPYVGDRVIDLSVKTAQLLGFHGHGLAKVKVDYVGRAPLAGSDDRKLMATLREGVPAPASTPVHGRRQQAVRAGLFRCPADDRKWASKSRRRPSGPTGWARGPARCRAKWKPKRRRVPRPPNSRPPRARTRPKPLRASPLGPPSRRFRRFPPMPRRAMMRRRDS